ncbi:MAG: PepSY-like domain-containing protein [Candidatus Binatia bacterium]
MSHIASAAMASIILLTSAARADTCPATVINAVKRAFPDGTITTCAAHLEKGQKQFEAKVSRGKAKVEIDVSPTGEILVIEEPIAVADLPASVAKAFAARYPKAKTTRAEKMTKGTELSFEIAFQFDGRRKGATFKLDGAFVEEE